MTAASLILTVLLPIALNSPPQLQDEPEEEESLYAGGAFLEEDREIAKWVVKARSYQEAREWSKCVGILQRVIEKGDDSVVSDDGRLYHSVRTHCHRLIASSFQESPGLIAAYRLATDVEASRLFEDARARRDPEGLTAVAARYFCSSVGDDALELAGDLFIHRKEYARALRAWDELLRYYPTDSNVDRAYLLAKMAFAASRLGRAESARDYLKRALKLAEGRPLRLGGEVVPESVFRERLLLGAEEPPQPDPREWPTAGGNASHSRIAPSIRGKVRGWGEDQWPKGLPTPWQVDDPMPPPPETSSRDRGFAFPVPELRRVPPTATVVSEGTVVTRFRDVLVAVDLRTGCRKWVPEQHESPRGDPVTGDLDSYDEHGRALVTVHDGKVFVVEGVRRAAPNMSWRRPVRSGGDRTGKSSIAAYRLDDGDLLWRTEAEGLRFATAPTAWEGRLFVPGEEEGQLFAISLDPEDGRILWKTFICGSPGQGHVQVGTPAAVSGGLVYLQSSAGVVAAVDGVDGNLEWIARYRRAGAGKGLLEGQRVMQQGGQIWIQARGGGWRQHTAADVTDSTATWISSPPIVTDGRLFVTPSDSKLLLCLEARTGEILWRADKDPDCTYLLGVTSRFVITGGKKIVAYEIDTGKREWESIIGKTYHGRGVASEEYVYVPAVEKVIRLDTQGGKRGYEYEFPGKGEMGNLTIVEGALLTAQKKRVSGFPILQGVEEAPPEPEREETEGGGPPPDAPRDPSKGPEEKGPSKEEGRGG